MKQIAAMSGATATATVCDNLALFGGDPDRDDFDTRETWDRSEAEFALSEAIAIMVRGIAIEGTQMHDELEPLLWGFPGTAARRPGRRV